jgi:hypothetical protein
MNITLQEWLEIHRAAREARIVLDKLDSVLSNVHLKHFRDDDVANFITTMQDRLADGRFITSSLHLQTEWTGGDSSVAENHGLREPNALNIVGHIPHLIPGSKGVVA